MKILLVVQDWISFYSQAEALSEGFKKIGVPFSFVRIEELKSNPEIFKKYTAYTVLGVGSWHSYDYFVDLPLKYGCKAVIPWIVSNGRIEKSSFVAALNKLKKIVTPSEYCKNVFIKYEIESEIIEVIPEAVDTDFWNPAPIEDSYKFLELFSVRHKLYPQNKYDLVELKKSGVPFLLTTGGDATSKGSQEVLKALSLLPKNLKWVYIIKTWPQYHTFEKGLEEYELIKKLHLEDRVRYVMGEFSKDFMRDLMNACDIYVSPSITEGFGLPFVQAQLCSKPIISVNSLSIKELVKHNETGYLTSFKQRGEYVFADISDLKNYLEILLKDKELRLKMGREGSKFARQNFSPETIAKRFCDVISSIT